MTEHVDLGLDSEWILACQNHEIESSISQFLEVTDVLLERVNLNSTHLFRADILVDTANRLEPLSKKTSTPSHDTGPRTECSFTPGFPKFNLERTVLRRLIPRNPQLDRALEQSCYFYSTTDHEASQTSILVIFVPHCEDAESMPWYHPRVKALAYLFTPTNDTTTTSSCGNRAALSVYYLPFSLAFGHDTSSTRLERTFLSLLHTYTRLLKHPSRRSDSVTRSSNHSATTNGSSHSQPLTFVTLLAHPLTPSSLRDTIPQLSQARVQNKYTQLKSLYANYLISNWVEKTEPSKHVFEDLGIAAFLIELWKTMYDSAESDSETLSKENFPGFVDIACGNGVLVWILVQEGWKGYGFDARRRQTWSILNINDHLREQVLIPQLFLDAAGPSAIEGLSVHNGTFAPGTFIISNHADELTCWTPLLAAQSNSTRPLPFLAIPCCSHALDGSRKRYSIRDISSLSTTETPMNSPEIRSVSCNDTIVPDEQPSQGDLKALKAQKARGSSDDKSQYGCLTRKTAALALECGIEVELTGLRIPSTRNIGVVGNRRQYSTAIENRKDGLKEEALEMVRGIVARECAGTGGLERSARTWIEKARRLQTGQGRGKLNLKGRVAGFEEQMGSAELRLDHIDEHG